MGFVYVVVIYEFWADRKKKIIENKNGYILYFCLIEKSAN